MNAEDIIITISIFLGIIPIIGILLGYINAFYWPVVLIVISIITAFIAWKIYSKDNLKMPSVPMILAIVITALFFGMMFKGAFNQPWLEDHDPYGYAIDSLYIAEEHTTLKDKEVLKGGYLEPDPPGYSVFMAFFYQTTGDMNRTLKFMNVLILSLGILCSFLFFKEFMQDEWKALAAMFVLACIPSFLTRFIFATALAVSLFFPALYCTLKSKDNPHYLLPAVLLIASILVTHHLSGFAFGIFFIIMWLFYRETNMFLCGLLGVLLSLSFWIPNFMRYGYSGIIEHFGLGAGESITNIVGSASRAYSFGDFIWAPAQNMINTSTGWGPFILILVIVGMIPVFYKGALFIEKKYLGIASVWLLVSLIAVNAFRLPFMLMPFRWWTFLAVPVAVMVAEALYWLYHQKGWGLIVVAIAVIGILITSAYPKYQINTNQWAPSASLMYPGLMEGHIWIMDNLPAGTHIYSFNQGPKLAGFNMYYCAWCKDDLIVEDSFLDITPAETNDYLKEKGYEYLLLDSWYFDRFDKNLTGPRINDMVNSGVFDMVYNNEGIVLLEVR
jgi:hypothetical protein